MPSMNWCGLRFEVVAILEGSGLAFVAVDGHQPRARLGAHEPPFAARRKARAAEAAQAAVGQRLDDVVDLREPEEARISRDSRRLHDSRRRCR